MVAFALDNSRPVFPVARHLGQDVAHDLCAGHETVLFALEDTDLAFAHELAEPSDIVDWHARVFAAVVDDYGAIDIFVAEADCLLSLEADDEVGCWVGVCCCAVPDCEGEALVEGALPFAFGQRQLIPHALLLCIIRV